MDAHGQDVKQRKTIKGKVVQDFKSFLGMRREHTAKFLFSTNDSFPSNILCSNLVRLSCATILMVMHLHEHGILLIFTVDEWTTLGNHKLLFVRSHKRCGAPNVVCSHTHKPHLSIYIINDIPTHILIRTEKCNKILMTWLRRRSTRHCLFVQSNERARNAMKFFITWSHLCGSLTMRRFAMRENILLQFEWDLNFCFCSRMICFHTAIHHKWPNTFIGYWFRSSRKFTSNNIRLIQ